MTNFAKIAARRQNWAKVHAGDARACMDDAQWATQQGHETSAVEWREAAVSYQQRAAYHAAAARALMEIDT